MHEAIAQVLRRLLLSRGERGRHRAPGAALYALRLGQLTASTSAARSPGSCLARMEAANVSTREAQNLVSGRNRHRGHRPGLPSATPLQLATIAARSPRAAARSHPRMVTAIRDTRTGGHARARAQAAAVVAADPAHWDVVISGMIGVTSFPHGTARLSMKDTPYKVAGRAARPRCSASAERKYDEKQMRNGCAITTVHPRLPRRTSHALPSGAGETAAAAVAPRRPSRARCGRLSSRQDAGERSDGDAGPATTRVPRSSHAVRRSRHLTDAPHAQTFHSVHAGCTSTSRCSSAAGDHLLRSRVLYSASGQNLFVVRAAGAALCRRDRSDGRRRQTSTALTCVFSRARLGARVLLLIVVAIAGHVGKGAQRWSTLRLHPLQPSS